jgi:hypothetical protein
LNLADCELATSAWRAQKADLRSAYHQPALHDPGDIPVVSAGWRNVAASVMIGIGPAERACQVGQLLPDRLKTTMW